MLLAISLLVAFYVIPSHMSEETEGKVRDLPQDTFPEELPDSDAALEKNLQMLKEKVRKWNS